MNEGCVRKQIKHNSTGGAVCLRVTPPGGKGAGIIIEPRISIGQGCSVGAMVQQMGGTSYSSFMEQLWWN